MTSKRVTYNKVKQIMNGRMAINNKWEQGTNGGMVVSGRVE
jgi:hypothetical protein